MGDSNYRQITLLNLLRSSKWPVQNTNEDLLKHIKSSSSTLTASWSVRTASVALIAFMSTKPDGALGSLEYTKEERHVLAIRSREATPRFGTRVAETHR
ncbi:unnamed protein product [Musa acuminata subsp. malaccensis]|uniref:(wild Malaysian banana) hypothetical protein n=1 Tax=Musa acuminata subsp. malaccensis TaxID=214687 RepID=A0A804JSK1_MUSAM|nr:unnamed protein product [Musa acuminata subsp. malaccensis]